MVTTLQLIRLKSVNRITSKKATRAASLLLYIFLCPVRELPDPVSVFDLYIRNGDFQVT